MSAVALVERVVLILEGSLKVKDALPGHLCRKVRQSSLIPPADEAAQFLGVSVQCGLVFASVRQVIRYCSVSLTRGISLLFIVFRRSGSVSVERETSISEQNSVMVICRDRDQRVTPM